jgi:16S rRNA processing protein RimM
MPSRLILVGQVGGAFGVRGELRVQAYTADPLSLVAYSPLRDENDRIALTLTAGRVVKGGLVANAREVETREQAQALRGLRLYIERERLPPAEDEEYYLADLIGLTVRSPGGETLGLVKSVADFGAGDLLEVAPTDGAPSWWTSFSRQVVPEVRIADGWLTVIQPAEEDS